MAGIGDRRRERLERAVLYLVIDDHAAGHVLEPALAGGVDIVQLRDKHAEDEEIVAAGRAFRALCDRHAALFIVNDRPDLALRCGADGVHVGQDDDSIEDVRAALGHELLIGVSTHSPEQIAVAQASSADYMGVGPVYETATKPDMEPVGEELVRAAAGAATKPFFAIGGIDAVRVARVIAAGARRIAVVRAIGDAEDPRAAAAALRKALANAAPPPLKQSRSQAKDDAARARLEPLGPGERPRAVTIAAVAALAIAAVNVVAYALGLELRGGRPSPVSMAAPALLMALAAWGLWRVRYWALLTTQVLLCIVIVVFSLAAFNARDLGSLLIAGAVVIVCGALFWSLVKAMARVRTPTAR